MLSRCLGLSDPIIFLKMDLITYLKLQTEAYSSHQT